MQIGLQLNKFRSGLEQKVADQLSALKIDYEYETMRIIYQKPAKYSYYKPDFILPNGIIIEAKGQFLTADRKKHKLIKDQFGSKYDIRFLFSNSKTKIGNKSKTTYAMWCEKLGFKYCDLTIPQSWINE
jgi:hypothetical protein